MSSSGSGLHEVAANCRASSAECCGKWTPNGKVFLFISDGQIWALDERQPRWSPDGQYLVAAGWEIAS